MNPAALSSSFALCAFLLGILSGAANAQEKDEWRDWPLADKFVITAGAFVANLDTRARVDSSSGILGTQIDFERNFGMSDLEPLPTIAAEWRFARRHQLALGYFELRRDGDEVTETTIRIGDTVFDVDLPVSSFFDVDTLGLSYQYSLIFDAKKELAIGLGLSVQDMRLGLESNQGAIPRVEESDVTAPLPTLGLTGGYAINDKWTMKAGVGYFAVEMDLGGDDDNLKGSIIDAGLFVHHQTFENVRFGLGYSYFDLDVSWVKKGKFTAVKYTYHGPHFTFGVNFD